MKILDRSLLTLLIVGVIALAFIESKGGVRKLLADRSWARRPQIDAAGSSAAPSNDSPSSVWGDGTGLFANPIAAAEGADGTFIQPMSATTSGAVKVSATDLASPANAGRFYRDPDKGLLFIALPDPATGRVFADASTQPARKANPPIHGDDGSLFPQDATAYPDLVTYFRGFLTPKRTPRRFAPSF